MNMDTRQALPTVVLWVVLVAALATAVSYTIERWSQVQAILPVIERWPDLDSQYKAQLKNVPYDLLRTADAVAPRDATFLLVTSGRDVTKSEYTTFHRALYFLAPRPVWWLSPAPSDGTWKSRWWTSRPLTGVAIKSEATLRGASYIVVYGVAEPLDLGSKVAEGADGYVVSLSGDATPQVQSSKFKVQGQSAGFAWPLQIALAVAGMLMVGGIILSVVHRLGYSPGRLEGLALAWSLGAGATSVLMLWLNALGLSLGWQIGVITALAAVWGVRELRITNYELRIRHSGAPWASPITGEDERWWKKYVCWVIGVILAVQILLVTITATGRPLDMWDSWVNWGVKARTIFLDGFISPALYADPSRVVTHLEYPLLFPLVQAWFYGWLGAPDDRFAGVAPVLFYLALMAVCYAAMIRGGADRTVALAAMAVIVTMSHMVGLAALVLAEMPLTLYCTIAGVYMLRWLDTGSRGALFLVALAAGLIPWTKKEGIALLAILGIAILVMNINRRRAWVGVGAMLLAAAVIAGPWWVFAAYNVTAKGLASPDFLPVTAEVLQANTGRAGTIARLGLDSLVGSRLSYIWPLAALGGIVICLVQRGRVCKRLEDFFPLAALMFVVLMLAAYLFSDYVPYTDHILTSVDRLVLPVTPLVVLWLVLRASVTNGKIQREHITEG